MFGFSNQNVKTVVCIFLIIQTVILVINMIQRQIGDVAENSDNELVVTTEPPFDNDTVEFFLSQYTEYCLQNHVPKQTNMSDSYEGAQILNNASQLCPCVPDTLIGRINITTFESQLIGELELEMTELTWGGTWHPKSCIPRSRVAIIVPFRDREEHLRVFLSILHPMLQRQMIHYTIFVIEQAEPAIFNKAALMNSGYVEAKSLANFDCYIFHDVDMLPEDDRNFYTCSDVPRHVGSHLDKWNYIVPYDGIFGGATAFTSEHFETVNGFSNLFYGWGGEDDDMYRRIRAKNLTIVRFSKTVARYTMIKHKSDAGNPYNVKSGIAWKFRPDQYATDGLNSLRHKLVAMEARPLYVWMMMTLPPHPNYFQPNIPPQKSGTGGTTQTITTTVALFIFLTTWHFHS